MPLFTFTYVTDPPNDELVNEVTQLNNNWTEVDTKTTGFNQLPSNISSPPQGTEAFYPGTPTSEQNRIAVWDGSAWQRAIDHSSTWTSWQNITLRSPVVERSGYTPKAKVDVVGRRVILSGGVILNATADPWNTATDYEITDDTAIQTSLSPATGGESYAQVATGQVTTANQFASAVIKIKLLTTPNRVALVARYQGDAGGGNFIMLDGVTWWY